MAKVDVEFSLTIKMDNTPVQYSKVGVKVSEINTEVPIKPQLEGTKKAVDEVWKYVFEEVYKQAEQVMEEEK